MSHEQDLKLIEGYVSSIHNKMLDMMLVVRRVALEQAAGVAESGIEFTRVSTEIRKLKGERYGDLKTMPILRKQYHPDNRKD